MSMYMWYKRVWGAGGHTPVLVILVESERVFMCVAQKETSYRSANSLCY